MNNFNLILLSAGKGTRFSGKKQFVIFKGQALFISSLKTFLTFNEFQNIILVIDKSDLNLYQEGIDKYLDRDSLKERILFVGGGEERFFSVWNALQEINQSLRFTFIHDVARPFIHREDIRTIFATLPKANQLNCGFVLGEKVVNTIKHKDSQGFLQSLPRESLVSVSTPQVFPSKELYLAYKSYMLHLRGAKKLAIPTDDAEVYNQYGLKVQCIYSKHNNKKITFQDDLL